MTYLIALDWGTTSCRAWLMASDGSIVESRTGGAGITQVLNGDFEGELQRMAGDWMTAHPEATLMASGMIGSRNGWSEVPYAPCPAGRRHLIEGLTTLPLGEGRRLYLVPGVSFVSNERTDIMRGEEAQILGLVDGSDDGLVVLPGTHSKWVKVKGGEIIDFSTYLTGELFAAIKKATLIGTMADGPENEEAFASGVSLALKGGSGFLNPLFALRADVLCGMRRQDDVASRLSGLLIGTELKEAFSHYGTPESVTLVGASHLSSLYARAFDMAGVTVSQAGEEAAARGLFAIYATLKASKEFSC